MDAINDSRKKNKHSGKKNKRSSKASTNVEASVVNPLIEGNIDLIKKSPLEVNKSTSKKAQERKRREKNKKKSDECCAIS